MSIESLLWGILPTGIALVSIMLSLACVAKKRKPLQFGAAVVVLLFTSFSLWLLKKIFLDGDWPTYLPHILIFVAAAIAVVQLRGVTRKGQNA